MTFEQWMAEFDKEVEKRFGWDSRCFPDWDFWGAWQTDMEISEAVDEYVKYLKDC